MSYTKIHDWETGTLARRRADNSEPYPLTDGGTLLVSVDGEADAVVAFDAADFADVANATAAEVVAAVVAQVDARELEAVDDDGTVEFTNARDRGLDSTIEITGGTDAAAFGFPAGTATGSGDGCKVVDSVRCRGLKSVRLLGPEGEYYGWEAPSGRVFAGALVKPNAAKVIALAAENANLQTRIAETQSREAAMGAVLAKRDAGDPLTDADRDVIADVVLGRI
jgi:hypothetical protein